MPSNPGKMIKSSNYMYLSVHLLISCQCPELWMLCHSEQYQSLFSMHLETISLLETQNCLLHYWWLYQEDHTLSRRSPQRLPLDLDLGHLQLQGKPTNWNLSVYSWKEKHTLEVGLINKICDVWYIFSGVNDKWSLENYVSCNISEVLPVHTTSFFHLGRRVPAGEGKVEWHCKTIAVQQLVSTWCAHIDNNINDLILLARDLTALCNFIHTHGIQVYYEV